jgi:hypothetical protein
MEDAAPIKASEGLKDTAQKYPYLPDSSRGMVWEAYKMGVPHYYNWMSETTFPARVSLHYFDPDTYVGSFCNLGSKCPWYMLSSRNTSVPPL